jgi:hypothetical protein
MTYARIVAANLLAFMIFAFFDVALADVPQQVQAFCESYAQRAQNVSSEASRLGCGYSGPRWDPNRAMHLSWCLGLKDLDVAVKEEEERQKGFAYCQGKRHACQDYANKAAGLAAEAKQKNCGYNPPLWDTVQINHLNWCMGLGYDKGQLNEQTALRDKELKYCIEKAAAGGGGQTPPPQNFCAVLLTVDVYPLPNRNDDQERKVILKKNTQGVTLIKRDPDGWHNVKWPGNDGWAWSGKGYQSLQCP